MGYLQNPAKVISESSGLSKAAAQLGGELRVHARLLSENTKRAGASAEDFGRLFVVC
jgi:hypothetical protein